METPTPFVLSPESPGPAPAPGPRPWVLIAAGAALLGLGLVGGYFIGVRSAQATPRVTAGTGGAGTVAASTATGASTTGESGTTSGDGSVGGALDQSAKFAGADAAGLAGPWLPELSNCLTDEDPGGPKLENGRAEVINCQIGDFQVWFETFESAQQFGWTRDYRAEASRKSHSRAPGAETPRQKTGPVTGKTGTYFEYVTGGTCGVFWAHGGALTALRLETSCASIDNDWPTLRAVWGRFS